MGTISNGHNLEWAQSRMITILNRHDPAWTQPQMGIIYSYLDVANVLLCEDSLQARNQKLNRELAITFSFSLTVFMFFSKKILAPIHNCSKFVFRRATHWQNFKSRKKNLC